MKKIEFKNRMDLLAGCCLIMLFMCSCATPPPQKVNPPALPEIPKYAASPLKIQEKTGPACVVVCNQDLETEFDSLKMLRHELAMLSPDRDKEIAAQKAKIAAVEAKTDDYQNMKIIAAMLGKSMKNCGYKVIQCYIPPPNKTAAYLEGIVAANKKYCVNVAVPPRTGEYTLSGVFADIPGNLIEADYNFGYRDRIAADRVIVVKELEKREAYDAANYGWDVKCRIEVFNSATSEKSGSVEVWGRYLEPLTSPLNSAQLENKRKNKNRYCAESCGVIIKNLLTMPEFKALVAGGK